MQNIFPTLENAIAKAKTDIKNRVDTYSEGKYSMTVGKQKYTDKKEAGKALAIEILAKAKEGQFTKVGEFAGFELQVIKYDRSMATVQGDEYAGQIVGAQSYPFDVKQFYLDSPTHLANEVTKKVEGIDDNLRRWEYALNNAREDLAAQEKLSKAPFAKQAELDAKTKRFDEVMAILNPQDEQTLDDSENDTQYQERDYDYSEDIRNDALYPKKKADAEAFLRSFANETLSLKNGSAKNIMIFTENRVYFATATGYLTGNIEKVMSISGNEEAVRKVIKEFKNGTYGRPKAFDTWAENIRAKDERSNRNYAGAENGGAAERINALDGGEPGSDTVGYNWENLGYNSLEELIEAVESGAMIMDENGDLVEFGTDTQYLSNAGDGDNSGTQYQQRSSPLTNREVLELAASGVGFEQLNEAEKNALEIFGKRLDNLAQLQEERVNLGREYMKQQFTKGGSRQEAAKTLNAMKVLDAKIKETENEVIGLENKEVLKKVLVKARTVVETKEKLQGQEALRRYRIKREESAAVRKYRTRVRNDVEKLRKWLVSPSNKDIVKHVPAEIQKSVADFLSSINMMSKTALRTAGLETTKADDAYIKSMRKMRNAIKSNVNAQGLYSGYADLPEDFFEKFDALIAASEELMKNNSDGFVVNLMSASELKQLSITLRTLTAYEWPTSRPGTTFVKLTVFRCVFRTNQSSKSNDRANLQERKNMIIKRKNKKNPTVSRAVGFVLFKWTIGGSNP